MKLLLLLSCFFCASIVNAKNFYISATGSDANTGLTSTTPWRTISKINASTFASGDSILFKCGEGFYGTLTPKTNGVNFSSYGTGAKPIITGLTTISSFTNLGNNIWEAVVPGGLATLNMVIIDGVLTPMGRYPNANTANGGYNTYESYVNNYSITDNQLTASPNFTGGDLVVRKVDFATARTTITSHSGTKLNFTIPAGSSFTTGYGYFIENSPATLDQNGEWYYNPTTHKISIFYTSTPPAIQVATLANLVSTLNSPGYTRNQISFKNIAFKGSESIMMNLSYCNNMTIDNCEFYFAGVNAIEHRSMNSFLIQNSKFNDINMVGIHEGNPGSGNGITIQNNTIRRIGINPGMISKSSTYHEGASSTGISIGATNLLIKQNIIDSVGYNGISIVKTKNNQIFRKNTISNFCFIKNDGGGIYNSGMRGDALPTINPIIDSNIIFSSLNAGNGTTKPKNPHARAIYLDASSSNINIFKNTIFNCYEGIYISQAQNVVIRGNTIYDAGSYIPTINTFSSQMSILDANNGYQHTRKNKITNNIFFSKYAHQLPYYQDDRYNGVDSIGIIDSNYYANPMNTYPAFITNTTTSSIIDLYSLGQWRVAHPKYDANSKPSPVSIPQFSSVFIGSNKSPNETFSANIASTTGYSNPAVHTISWDGTSQINGTGSIKLTNNVTSKNFTQVSQIIGALDASKKYVLRFKTKGAKPGTFQTYLQQWTGAYAIITSIQKGSIGVGVEQHEIQFSGEHSTQTNAKLYIQFSQNSSTTYIDDIQFYEATTTPTNINDYLRFEYNASNSAKTVALDAKYIGVDSTVYNGTVTLQPYTSVVLIKSGATTQTILKAVAGADTSIVLPTNTVALKGSAIGTATSYTWTKIAGPTTGTITSPGSASTAVTNFVAGDYLFQLKVMNSAGKAALDTIKITVTGSIDTIQTTLKAVAGSDISIILPINTVTLKGSAIGTATSYTWTKVAGPTAGTITSPNSASTGVTDLITGHYFFQLKVLNSTGKSALDTIRIIVTGSIDTIQTTLKAVAGSDMAITLPTNTITLTGSAIGTATSYTWTKVAGPTAGTITNPTSASTGVTNLIMGHYFFQLKVLNSAGKSSLDTIKIIVNGALPSAAALDITTLNNNVNLNWEAATKDSFSNYTIERSEDGLKFTSIGQINSTEISKTNNYNFSDNSPVSGVNFYRLAMVDSSGKANYSKTVSAAIEKSFALQSLMVSVSNKNIKMVINCKEAQVINMVVADVSGRILYSNPTQLQTGLNVIDKKISSVITGVYFVKLFNNKDAISKSVLSNQ